MSDLIDRQAAIDAPVKMVSEGIEWIPVYHLKDLPSAQLEPPEPEELDFVQPHKKIGVRLEIGQPEIIRCKDCKHRDPEDKKCDCGHGITWQLPRPDEWFCADAERRTE